MSAQSAEQLKGLGYVAPGAGHAVPVAGPLAQGDPSAGLEAMAAARKLIRTGQMTLVVDSYPRASEAVKRIAEAHGGYLAEAQAQRGAQDRRQGSLTIRVAAESF